MTEQEFIDSSIKECAKLIMGYKRDKKINDLGI
jgi:hypothetical protein